MSVILTLTSTMTGDAITPTTSGIVQSEILSCALIANGVLVVVLLLHYVMSEHDSWNANIMAALRTISVPLVVIFCIFLAFTTANLL
jgi:hypothetical protein